MRDPAPHVTRTFSDPNSKENPPRQEDDPPKTSPPLVNDVASAAEQPKKGELDVLDNEAL